MENLILLAQENGLTAAKQTLENKIHGQYAELADRV
jgi:hypothetical protein